MSEGLPASYTCNSDLEWVHQRINRRSPYGEPESPSVRITELEGRGRALVASKPLKAGEVILKDSPILLYSALPLNPPQPQTHHYCTHCFRLLSPSNPSITPCPSCSTLFCNPNCSSLAHSSSHSPWVCQSLSRLMNTLPNHSFTDDLQVQARFLIAAFNLDPSRFRTLLCLQGEHPSKIEHSVEYLHAMIFSHCPPLAPGEFGFSLELTAALLAKDKVNAFGLMEPFSEDGERSVRAYGLYPNASFFNHDCLPNACRFDYVDGFSSCEGNTDIIVRLIHDIPQGREICVSYFPVNLTYSERQRRLKEDYGFACVCDRCKVEANWSDDEEEQGNVDEDEEEEEAMEEDNDEAMGDSEDGGVAEEDNFPHSYFFVRYMCSRNNCWGTLAPLPPANGAPSATMECNVCGSLRNDEEAMD